MAEWRKYLSITDKELSESMGIETPFMYRVLMNNTYAYIKPRKLFYSRKFEMCKILRARSFRKRGKVKLQSSLFQKQKKT